MTLSQIVFQIFITLQITPEVFSQFLNSNPSLGRDPSLPSPSLPSPPSLDLITAMSSQYNKLLQILPDNFYAFNQKYSLVQCAMCFQMATQYEVTQCLLCGQMLCMHRCGQATDSPSNLTDHARTSHGGSSLFVSNNCASVVIIHRHNAFVTDSLYVDQFGVGFSLRDEKRQDWAVFRLDQGTLRRLFSALLHNQLGQEIIYE